MEILGNLFIYIAEAAFLFLRILYWMIIIEVILSWLALFGMHIHIKALTDITRPLYRFVKKYIPTTIGMIDFSPIILIFGLQFLMNAIAVMLIPALRNFF